MNHNRNICNEIKEIRVKVLRVWQIIVIIIFEDLIQERLYNFHIIQADYNSQPLSQTSSTSKRRSLRPGSYEMNINGNYYYYYRII